MLVQSLGQEDSLEEDRESYSSILGPSQVMLVLKKPSSNGGDVRDEGLILGLGIHSSIPAESPWAEEPGRLQSMGLERVAHD